VERPAVLGPAEADGEEGIVTTTAAYRRPRDAAEQPRPRVAIYARKSTDKGLDGEFTTIHNQVRSVRAYVESQAAQRWVALPEPYADGGFSGATTDRPAFQRLIADVQAGRVDVIAVYRLDRLSRSVRDFLEVLALLDKHNVQFVSVTEHFDTTTPMGRFTLGIFMQVAQLEREVIAERVGHKMLAARRLGKWQGGRPCLGYDSVDKKLVVNAAEAADVVAIFETFARTRSLIGTLRELNQRGIRNKSWIGKRGQRVRGQPFTKNNLTRLLTNVLYRGQIRAGDEIAPGEHEAIVPEPLWDEVQAIFAEGRVEGGRPERQPWSALLTGILKCSTCGSSMVPTYTVKGAKRYGYYQCQRTKALGAAACRGSRVPQSLVERAVVERIMALGQDPALLADAVAAAQLEVSARRTELAQDAQRAGTEAHHLATQRDELVAAAGSGDGDMPELRQRLDAVRQAHEDATRRTMAAKDALAALKAPIDQDALRRAISGFTPVWDALFPAERERLIHLLVERVTIDCATGRIDISFHDDGVAQLAEESQE
jgi:site-specific DNA recombinase